MKRTAFTGSLFSSLGCALVLSASSGSAGAQILYTVTGDTSNDRLGAGVGNAGDYDQDTLNDLIGGAPENFNVFDPAPGFARVYRGFDGAVLETFVGDTNWDAFGSAVDGAGDVDMDGFADVIIGARSASVNAPQAGQCKVISGQTGATLYTFLGTQDLENLGSAVAGAGDVNDDGYDDVIVGLPNHNAIFEDTGEARVYSGFDGAMLWSFEGNSSSDRVGISVAPAGDLNSDGHADVIVGSFFDGVKVYSGDTGLPMLTFPSTGNADTYGKSVSAIADVSGDGVNDILIGASEESVLDPGEGFVQCRSGSNGALLWTVTGLAQADRFGIAVTDCGDWNGDGTPDAMIGADPTDASRQGYVRIYSGVDGTFIDAFLGDADTDDFGRRVAGLGDVTGMNRTYAAVGAPNGSPSGVGSGYIRVFEGAPGACGGTMNYCVAAPNSAGDGAQITSAGTTSVGANDLVLLCTGVPAMQNGIFYFGPNQVQLPFGDGFRCVGGAVNRFAPVQADGGGLAVFPVDYGAAPADMILPLTVWNFQFWYRDPAAGGSGFNLSDGLEIDFCP